MLTSYLAYIDNHQSNQKTRRCWLVTKTKGEWSASSGKKVSSVKLYLLIAEYRFGDKRTKIVIIDLMITIFILSFNARIGKTRYVRCLGTELSAVIKKSRQHHIHCPDLNLSFSHGLWKPQTTKVSLTPRPCKNKVSTTHYIWQCGIEPWKSAL